MSLTIKLQNIKNIISGLQQVKKDFNLSKEMIEHIDIVQEDLNEELEGWRELIYEENGN